MKRFLKDDRGATSIEYALIALLIFLVIISGVSAVGTNVAAVFPKISSNLTAR